MCHLARTSSRQMRYRPESEAETSKSVADESLAIRDGRRLYCVGAYTARNWANGFETEVCIIQRS